MPGICSLTDDCMLFEFLHGRLPEAQAQDLERHLLRCDACAEALDQLTAQDPLITPMRAHVEAGDMDEAEVVVGLIDRVRRLSPPEMTPAPDAAGELRGDNTPSGAATEERLSAFLAPAQGPAEIGRLGPYRVLKVLGAGGMGIVFEAEDPQLKRAVALKAMKPALALNAANRQRFLREAQATAALEHDHIIAIHHVGEDRGVPFLAMQLLHGETLETRLKRQGQQTPTEVLRIGREIADGLAAAHAHGLIHRDIKPANIWLESRGEESGVRNQESGVRGQDRREGVASSLTLARVKILDFGLARSPDEAGELTQWGVIAGTPAYMAPEQARGQPEARSDLFSLGCVLYQLCTGVAPFRGATTMAVLTALAHDDPPSPRSLNPQTPPALADLILQLLAKDPERRPPTAQAVVQAITMLERQQAERSRPVPRRKRWLPSVLVATSLLVVLGIASYQFGPAVYRLATNQGQIVIQIDDPAGEVTIKQNGQEVKIIDSKSGSEITLSAGKYQIELSKGKDVLKLSTSQFTLERGGKEIVRVWREPAAANPAPVQQPIGQPFVITPRSGRAEAKFATLAEAVAGTRSGDTIEVRSDGPPITKAIRIAGKALTIRAAAGAVPTLILEPSAVQDPVPNLETDSALTLEGLVFHTVNRSTDQKSYSWTVVSNQAPLRVANCRFIDESARQGVIAARGCPRFELRNCQATVRPTVPFVDWACRTGGEMVMDNNVVGGPTGHAVVVHHRIDANLKDVRLRLSHNSMVQTPVLLLLYRPEPATTTAKQTAPTMRVDALENVFASTAVVFSFGQQQAIEVPGSKVLDSGAGAEALLRRLVDWREERNVYAKGINFLHLGNGGANAIAPTTGRQSLAAWQQLWGIGDSGSLQGRIRLEGEDRVNKATDAALTPADFRLRPDSVGKGTGARGRDPGADVDLVGPGAAYERWKLTPEYRQWLKDTERLQTRANEPFVVLAQGDKAEYKFPTLAEAVAAARSGDTIEICGNGPFDCPSIVLGDKALTIRAAAGARPVLKLSADALSYLLNTRAALVLEGLEIQRDDRTRDKVEPMEYAILSQKAPFYAANCRFTIWTKEGGAAILLLGSPRCEVRNCQFAGTSNSGFMGWVCPKAGRILLENNVIAGGGSQRGLAFHYTKDGAGSVSLRLTRNTMTVTPLWFLLDLAPPPVATPEAEPPFHVEMTANVVDAAAGILHFEQAEALYDPKAKPLLANEAEVLLRRLLNWREQANVYPDGDRVFVRAFTLEMKPPLDRQHLADWPQFWSLKETNSLQGPIHYEGGDVRAKLASAPEKVTPADFRLHQESAGYRAGKDQLDLGADVDLIGPGPAYERWRKTAEYQQWLKDTKQSQ